VEFPIGLIRVVRIHFGSVCRSSIDPCAGVKDQSSLVGAFDDSVAFGIEVVPVADVLQKCIR
jgi:hypothetical protein